MPTYRVVREVHQEMYIEAESAQDAERKAMCADEREWENIYDTDYAYEAQEVEDE